MTERTRRRGLLGCVVASTLVAACVTPGMGSDSGSTGADGAVSRDGTTADGSTMQSGQDSGAQTADVMGSGSDAAATSCRPLNQWQRKMLDAHNRWRSSVSPAAAHMFRVSWDENIARNAAQWVSSCDPNWPHSPASSRTNVGGYPNLGENLSYCAGTGCTNDPSITDGSGKGDGEGWWDERNDYNYATDQSTGVTSHYTQMVSSNVYAIGCATQRCNAPGPSGWNGEWWWTICQYGPRGQAYFVGTRPYATGSGGLEDPPASMTSANPGLCR